MSYGMVRLPPPSAGRYTRYACLALDKTDDGFGLGMTGMMTMLFAPILIGACYAEGSPILGTALLVVLILTQIATSVAVLWAWRTGVKVNKSLGSYSGERVYPHEVWQDYRRLRDPAIRSTARPLWWAFLSAVEAYSIGENIDHLGQAAARAARIHALAKAQEEVDAARALTRAGSGVVDTDDVERADQFLRSLRELS